MQSAAHRMGQEHKVFAYRMVARGTVEEKILELQRKKKDLAESIISEDTDFMKKSPARISKACWSNGMV